MCRVLQISRSTYYYKAKERKSEDDIIEAVLEIFHIKRKTYGTRKIKVELYKRGFILSRRRIGRIMAYTKAQFKAQKIRSNESKQENKLNRQFKQDEAKKVVVSDILCSSEKQMELPLCSG
ncbi:IS3 family transposase [Shimazuella sp. KC615]|uniref:IS3 family transposase n=1 Tax=Shimazuella alba TaxID=2690964 RepID=A0A6I4VSM5_9BACL|nr:IS3 family transposase [Shimazuella alba]MXQ54023.1 IS3 family transposase [Shimazuella alba]